MNKLTMLLLVFLAIAIIFFGIVVFGFGYGSDLKKPNWSEPLLERCVHSNITYFYMLISNATECDSIVKWHDTHNWQFVTENRGEIVLTFENDMTAKEKALEEGIVENK